ncbi:MULTISPECIES: cation:proton antiporter [Aestuariibaculum]|uniref:Cation:proton antiporter n=1 Tax=Aestuariibaculum lutulentum TaxID=2920935 RepID=A0ABS9RJ89_9FLAO|nr:MULTISPECIES: cation:proton antiporter [Aestuariibaculum]MCH4552177.1 cation:proton antiporter [Aestuariibaculum lutulentum]MCR8667270.1 cation:proton antiporter [Aestuariibaculum sp. M13]
MIELSGIVILGILSQWVAWRMKLPAILPLILIGLFVGPISTLFSADGSKWIEPVWNGDKGLFPGDSLYSFVSLAIGIILFEGGLTLKRNEISKVGPVILKLISVGGLITFIGGGLAAHFIFGLSWEVSFLFSALIIVTGPTVIAPILRNIPLKKEISTVLKWEGILIDPIGALAAVLMFEFISIEETNGYTLQAIIEFGKIVIVGISFGTTAALILYFSIKKKLIPHYLLNVTALSVVLLVFVESDIFAHESGLLAVVVMGMVLGNSKLPNLKELLYFKESLSVLLISILFILLSANINLEDLLIVYNWKTVLLMAIIIFVLRPLGVFLSCANSGLKFNEKAFISWVGPRGIVAAGIASLFGTKLTLRGEPYAEYITPLVFTTVLVTVLLNAASARYVAKWIGVYLKASKGILIIGASEASRIIARYLKQNARHVVLIDNNLDNIEKAKNLDLDAMQANIYSEDLTNDVELSDIGYLLAFTGSDEINKYSISKFKDHLGERGSYRLISSQEIKNQEDISLDTIFSTKDDFINFSEVARDYPVIHEININTKEEYLKKIDKLNREQKAIPLFVKDRDGELHIICTLTKEFKIEKEFKLVYLGKPYESIDV